MWACKKHRIVSKRMTGPHMSTYFISQIFSSQGEGSYAARDKNFWCIPMLAFILGVDCRYGRHGQILLIYQRSSRLDRSSALHWIISAGDNCWSLATWDLHVPHLPSLVGVPHSPAVDHKIKFKRGKEHLHLPWEYFSFFNNISLLFFSSYFQPYFLLTKMPLNHFKSYFLSFF